MKKDQGLIRWIILIIIAVIILGYFGIDVRGTVESPTTQDNLAYLKEIAIKIWENILRVPVFFLWEHVIIPLIHMLFQNKG